MSLAVSWSPGQSWKSWNKRSTIHNHLPQITLFHKTFRPSFHDLQKNEWRLTSVNVDSTCSRMFSPWLGGFCWVRTTNLLNRSKEPSPIRIPPLFSERSLSIGIGLLFRCHTRLHKGKHWTIQCNWTLFWWYGMPVITQKFSQKKTTMQWQCTWNWRKTLYKSWWRVDSYGSGSRLCHTHPVKGNAGVIPGRIDVSMVEGQPKVCPPLDFMTIVKPPDHGSRRKTRIFHSTFDLKHVIWLYYLVRHLAYCCEKPLE